MAATLIDKLKMHRKGCEAFDKSNAEDTPVCEVLLFFKSF